MAFAMLPNLRSIHAPLSVLENHTLSPHSVHFAALKQVGAWRAAASFSMLALLVGCGSDEVTQSATSESPVTINELQSRNSTIESDIGKKSDWVELYNPSDAVAKLEGYFISDDRSTPQKGKLPSDAVVPGHGFLVLWLDDTNSALTPLHFPFKLSGAGDYLFLSDPSGHVIRSVALPADPTGADTTLPDVSYGAFPDGSEKFHWCATPTIGEPNAPDCGADAGT